MQLEYWSEIYVTKFKQYFSCMVCICSEHTMLTFVGKSFFLARWENPLARFALKNQQYRKITKFIPES